ncbi:MULTISPECIES: NAD(P)/FAD-dependent oxidoreductase [unclassified Phycicoccus]|uniref:NAD(P)/FAD-dependent oxidoreductase n=1 Tax=unclassified Phycicoccus TaxID=2637926 RepID=UPI000703BBAB|nr:MULTISPECIES: FAD-dependent oxidoreductase [unclassified Phycicoccus]KQU66434.1 pyridine nucleotide-disulfide oxidoreductase [Phycicoccus sp. Root101]KQZ87584.1 pyridine nucleotide-disulfide oxidoreductase [Phycicoccus sp. Root563]
MADERTFVVVGGGLAGAKSVEALRDKGFEGRLVLLAGEDHLPYERPPLSKDYLKTGEGLDDAFVHDQDWYAAHDVEVRTGTVVTAVDRDAHEVVTAAGERIGWNRLLLATGSSPRHLDLPGADLDGVLSLRTIEDSDRLRGALQPGRRVVLVGGGWIGLEVAAAAREAGATVTVLESLDLPLVRVLGPTVAQVFADLHREHGVDLRTGVQVEELVGEGGSVTGVRLADGSTVPADLVVVGIGAAPNTGLAADAGLEVDNGIVADAVGRTSDPEVFVVGDVANVEHPFLGRRVRVEHWANALNQPTIVAAGMLEQSAPEAELPYFFTDQYDLGMEYHGLGAPDDEVVVRGDLTGREFVAFWLRDGAVTAGMNVNVWDVGDAVKGLIRSRASVDRAKLADPGVPLENLT